MKGILLLVPFFAVRFGFLSFLSKNAVQRAAYFPPMYGKEKAAYWIYQISNTAIIVYMCFLHIKAGFFWQFYLGLCCYLTGLILCAASIYYFAAPSDAGVLMEGIYRWSRNPMYVSYFVLFAGCALLTQSVLLGGLVIVFQISSHWIILAEERWCIEKFGETYRQYMKKVRRYVNVI